MLGTLSKHDTLTDDPMLVKCRASVEDDGPTLKQYWFTDTLTKCWLNIDSQYTMLYLFTRWGTSHAGIIL